MTMRLVQLTSIKVCQTSEICKGVSKGVPSLKRDARSGVLPQLRSGNSCRQESYTQSNAGLYCIAGTIYVGAIAKETEGYRPASSHRRKTPTRRIENEIHARPTVASH